MNRTLPAIAIVFGLWFAYPAVGQTPAQAIIVRLANPQYAGRDARRYSFSADQIKDIRNLAKLGDTASQYDLGVIRYVQGAYRKAARWFKRAADMGYADAEYDLGIMYFNGRGVDQSFEAAAHLLRQSARQGQPNAQFRLATLYYTGRGVARNSAKEAFWLEQAARQGLTKAQYNLAVMYANGDGIFKSPVKAYAWLTVADRLGLDTTDALAIVSKNMSYAQIRAANRLSAQLLADQKVGARFGNG
jgi:TPR repeat protein